MSNVKSTKNMTFGELKEYYKNNKTMISRMMKAESAMRERGMTDEEIKHAKCRV